MISWKDQLQAMFYLHYRLLTSGIFLVGGMVALGVIYVFLLTSASVDSTQNQEGEVVINKGALQRITTWNTTKQNDSKVNVVVPNTAFVIPSSAP